MARIYDSATQLIGGTPLLKVNNYMAQQGIADVNLLVKLEYLNPAGSAKDRVALQMILDAEQQGLLQPGATIIEPTSGNTGIGLASVAASRGYHTILTLPDTMSVERRNMLRAYGAQLVLTEGAKGMNGAIAKAEELQASIPGSLILGQFDNPSNPVAHERTTGPEIWQDTDGQVDIFVAGVGTGGTFTGVGRYLKAQNPDIQMVAVEPADSPVLSGGAAGAHGLQGIGAGFVPSIMDTSLIDEIITVRTQEAFAAGRLLARKEGFLVGITSGAALHAAALLAKRPENKGKTIVVLLPDSGDRYLSSPMFTEE
ncbi:MAG: cysteine synthase A [Lachnospiraceae bacterium]|nr:cysteine synthase A [Lachnospiraceae bacterium]